MPLNFAGKNSLKVLKKFFIVSIFIVIYIHLFLMFFLHLHNHEQKINLSRFALLTDQTCSKFLRGLNTFCCIATWQEEFLQLFGIIHLYITKVSEKRTFFPSDTRT